jgi:hypothetical protein
LAKNLLDWEPIIEAAFFNYFDPAFLIYPTMVSPGIQNGTRSECNLRFSKERFFVNPSSLKGRTPKIKFGRSRVAGRPSRIMVKDETPTLPEQMLQY